MRIKYTLWKKSNENNSMIKLCYIYCKNYLKRLSQNFLKVSYKVSREILLFEIDSVLFWKPYKRLHTGSELSAIQIERDQTNLCYILVYQLTNVYSAMKFKRVRMLLRDWQNIYVFGF